MLGSDDFFLRQLAGKADFSAIKDYIAWTMHAAQAIAVKVVNPGGISAFKFNQRKLDLNEKHVYYGVTPRDIIVTLARGLNELGVVHPLHIHGCNLGVPGGYETTLDTIKGAEGLPIHLTHIQFHSYGTEGDLKFSSAAAPIAEAVNANKNVSCDVGQVMFGQTCTASGDSMRQFVNTRSADPKKWVVMDIECDAGCGVVPFKYRDKSFVNALQWAIGLELFLLVNDPWRLFLTTDHPNGGPFTWYPHLIRLLMDKEFRQRPDADDQSGRAEVFDARLARPRIFALRNRDHDARRPGTQPRPRTIAAISASAPGRTSPSTTTIPIARRCSRRRSFSSRTAN